MTRAKPLRVGAGVDAAYGRFINIDLKPHFNNRGATRPHERRDGNFNYKKNSYPREELATDSANIILNGIPFNLEECGSPKNDNLICLEQFIPFPKEPCRLVHLLGASDMGSYPAMLTLVTCGGRKIARKFGLSLWWGHNAPPEFNEQVAFTFSCLRYRTHDQNDIHPRLLISTVVVGDEEPLAGLWLPDNPFMHIFGITLRG